jgi:HD-GYP domain-containing protein (c-di-GMP phosphodiesterase class II)
VVGVGGVAWSTTYGCGVAAAGTGEVRLAELVALLSLGTDLGLGQPMEHMIRACLIGLRLADDLGVGPEERAVVYYAGLLAWVGCHTDAYEQAKWLGDDTVLKADAHYVYDLGRAAPTAAFLLRHIGAGRPLLQRVRTGMGFVGDGRRALMALAENHYLAADELAARLGLSDGVRASLRQTYERWDGKGVFGLKGEQIALSSRLINLADVVEFHRRLGGVEAALEVASERAGTQFDPGLVARLRASGPALLADLDAASSWQEVIDAEPSLSVGVPVERFDDVVAAIGQFAELKAPWRMGHAERVSELVEHAARELRLPDDEVVRIRRAALVADLGYLGVPNTIWDKPGGLAPAEWERVRLHPYLGARMLSFSSTLRDLAATVANHHERMDGSGYPAGLRGDAIAMPDRLLAAADVYQALREPRPHRPARSLQDAGAALRSEVVNGRLDGDAVDAVLGAAGHRVRRRRDWPGGLTAREVEVIRLIARGMSTNEIARQLTISAKTAGTHVEHIYSKIGVSNRTQASLFALRHGLMTEHAT